MLQRLKKNYHWLIAFLVFAEMIVYGGMINSYSLFTLPISDALGVSTTDYSLASIPYTCMCFISTCLSGILFSRFGYKKVALVSLGLITASLVITGLGDNLLVYGFGRLLFGMGYGACLTAGSVRIIKDWFSKHQGLVLGAVNMATGLGGSLMTLVLSGIITGAGWRAALYVCAVITGVVMLSFLLIRDRPDQMGLRPFGFGTMPKATRKARPTAYDWPGFSMAEQWKRPSFYIMCVAVLVCCVCLYTTSSFVVPHFVSIGFTTAKAASYQAIYMFTLAVAKLGVGFLYDRLGVKPSLYICMGCAIASQLLLGYFTDPTVSLIGIELFAVGLCMSSLMIPLLTVPLFGYRGSMAVNGIFLGFSSFASVFSSPIASACYDATGLYSPVYRVTAVVNVGILVLFLLLFRLAKNDRKRYFALHGEA